MKIRIPVKRICFLFSSSILALLLLIVLTLNSPLVSRVLTQYLTHVTGQNVYVGSARLSLFPAVKLAATSLSFKESDREDPSIAIQTMAVEINASALLDRNI